MADMMCEYCTLDERSEGSRFCEDCLREFDQDSDETTDNQTLMEEAQKQFFRFFLS